MEENEDRIYNLHFNYPFFFYKFVLVINSCLFFFYKVLICVVYPNSYPQSYASMLTSGNWSSLSSTRSGRISCSLDCWKHAGAG